jgi:D-tyrosyl-tRNA(Tyr) deacylase
LAGTLTRVILSEAVSTGSTGEEAVSTGSTGEEAVSTGSTGEEAGSTGEDGSMRAVVQRVSAASVTVDGEVVGELAAPGLLVYLGLTHTDAPDDATWMARKIWTLRILPDEQSASDLGAPVLVVSQFTLYGDARKGRRPTWESAAPGPVSEPLYDAVCSALAGLGAHVERGVFGAQMQVSCVNDGPFTVLLER